MKSKNTSNSSSIRQAFSDTVIQLARHHQNLYVVSADLKSSLTLSRFSRLFPSRFIECGVAESNAAGVAAGLAKSGKTVFLATYACFSPAINWAVIKQSICYNHLPVKIIGSHAGLLTGELAATHQMLEDLALMRSLPGMEVFSPADATETGKIVRAIFHSPHPSYLRLVRPATPVFTDPKSSFTIGSSKILHRGTAITILGHGPILSSAMEITNHSLEIINCSSIKPLDSATILKSVKKTGRLIVIEDHQKIGGLGEAVASLLLSRHLSPYFIHLAVDNRFGQSSIDPQTLYDHYGIGLSDLIKAVDKLMST